MRQEQLNWLRKWFKHAKYNDLNCELGIINGFIIKHNNKDIFVGKDVINIKDMNCHEFVREASMIINGL